MSGLLRRMLARDWSPARATAAGLAATVAYSVAMEADQKLTGNNFNDVVFIQGLLNDPQGTSQRANLFAWLLHLFNGVMLAQVYAALLKRWLPGPGWLRGLLFGEAFVLLVWPVTPQVDRAHPMIKSGRLPQLANWTSFRQNILRHLAFGLVLGLLYKGKTPRK